MCIEQIEKNLEENKLKLLTSISVSYSQYNYILRSKLISPSINYPQTNNQLIIISLSSFYKIVLQLDSNNLHIKFYYNNTFFYNSIYLHYS